MFATGVSLVQHWELPCLSLLFQHVAAIRLCSSAAMLPWSKSEVCSWQVIHAQVLLHVLVAHCSAGRS